MHHAGGSLKNGDQAVGACWGTDKTLSLPIKINAASAKATRCPGRPIIARGLGFAAKCSKKEAKGKRVASESSYYDIEVHI